MPIFGWLFLRGRCAGCHERISVEYPLVELFIALLWGATVWHYGPTFLALRVAVLGTVLTGIALTDAKHYLIPDGFTVFGLIWVLATAFLAAFLFDVSTVGDIAYPASGFNGGIVESSGQALIGSFAGLATSPFVGPYNAVIGACAGAGIIAIAGWLGEVALKREAMGFGDVTLMAVVGAAVGPNRAILTVFIGAALGVAIFLLLVLPITALRRRRIRTRAGLQPTGGHSEAPEETELPLVPFGVFLAPAAFIALLWGDALIGWYSSSILGI